MKRIYSIAILVLAITSLCHAQVPGYMGKRLHIQAGINFFPQFSAIPVNVVQPYNPYFISGFNYRANVGIDFVITRKSVIGINAQYFNTAYDNGFGRFGLEGGSVGFVFKTHFGEWVAPLGPYFKAEAGGIFYGSSDPLNLYGGSFVTQLNGNGYIGAGFGRTHIFANILSLDYGAEMAMVFPPYTNSDNRRMAIHYAASMYIKLGVVL